MHRRVKSEKSEEDEVGLYAQEKVVFIRDKSYIGSMVSRCRCFYYGEEDQEAEKAVFTPESITVVDGASAEGAQCVLRFFYLAT